MHPIVVHFPIVLLLIAPLFIVIGMVHKPERSRPYLGAALILMSLGTASIFLAAFTGEAAGDRAGGLPEVDAALLQHEDLAETSEIAFAALTLIFSAIVFGPRIFKLAPSRAFSTALPLIFLLFYTTGAITLTNTAHQGGRLVHELGIHSEIQPRDAPVPAPASLGEANERE
jgi:uncharacterized membrane protein